MNESSKEQKIEEKKKPDNPWDGDPKLVKVLGACGPPLDETDEESESLSS